MFRLFAALCLLASLHAQQAGGRGAGAAAAQPPPRIPSIEERTGGMQKLDGFFPVYWEERTGRLWFDITGLDPAPPPPARAHPQHRGAHRRHAEARWLLPRPLGSAHRKSLVGNPPPR